MKLDDLDLIGLLVCLFLLVVVIVAEVIRYEERQKRKRKPNVRVPRETLWTRTNRYHHGE